MDFECCICLEETLDKINCHHKLCRTCFKNYKIKECPICFKKIVFSRKKKTRPPFLLPKL